MRLHALAYSALMAMALTGCKSMIYDDLDPCPQGVELRFVYDYNMEWANAFPSKVHCLTVLVYNEQGQLVERQAETSEAKLSDEAYRMAIDLPAGNYHVVAYGGMECANASFAFDSDLQGLPNENDSFVAMTTLDAEGVSQAMLHDHFYGTVDVAVSDATPTREAATVEMMKNTNHLRIMLQQVDGEPLRGADFAFSITDDNSLFAHTNALLPRKEITYKPWSQTEKSAGLNDTGEDWTMAIAELSTSRLTTRSARSAASEADASRGGGAPSGTSTVDTPLLKISKADGEEIASLPLINYLLLFKSDRYADLPDQEFLDRMSEWNIILFLDKNQRWITTHIVVNDWVVRLNSAGF